VETNWYFLDVTESEMFALIAIIIQIGHAICDNMKDYPWPAEQFFPPFMAKQRVVTFSFIFLDFSIFQTMTSVLDNNDLNYYGLRMLRHIFDLMNNEYLKYYAPSEHLVGDEVTVCFSGNIILKQHEGLAIKMYKLCDISGYTYDVDIYLGKDSNTCKCTVIDKKKGGGWGMDKDISYIQTALFSLRDLRNDLTKVKIDCCKTQQQREHHRTLYHQTSETK
jgi:hypothetical protein